MSTITRFKQSVSHGKERKAHQPLPASAWATPRPVLTCITYVSLVSCDPFCSWCRTTLRLWNISCFNVHASSLNILHYAPALRPGHHNTQPAHPLGGLRHPPFLATCCPSPYLCLIEEDRPATTPVILTQEYPRTHKDP
ncbi:hypothetical protein E2C01_037778 [Portunus trituberculatus]|uniref:Uncharacterized protein n=1 Tax=Portunus trituberculatus TaxID=210409 RepID=A0A5B7FI36_PORTR|nr:hypothetical protein [Portunus trituberculatus]